MKDPEEKFVQLVNSVLHTLNVKPHLQARPHLFRHPARIRPSDRGVMLVPISFDTQELMPLRIQALLRAESRELSRSIVRLRRMELFGPEIPGDQIRRRRPWLPAS